MFFIGFFKIRIIVKGKHIIFLNLLAAGCQLSFYSNVMAQSNPCRLLQLVEWSEDGKQLPISDANKIVEPNSKIHVLFNKDCLKSELSGAIMGQDVTDRLNLLSAMLANESKAMKDLNDAISAYNANKPDSVWMKPLQRIRPYAFLILKNKESRAVYVSLKDDNTPLTEYANLFNTASIIIPKMLDEIQTEAKQQGVYVQLGAWLDAGSASSPIHIDGFDDYVPQTPSTVERFHVLLTPAQQAALDSITVLSNTANKDGLLAAVKKVAGNAGQGIAQKLQSLSAYTQATALLTSLQTTSALDQTQLGALKNTLTSTYQAVQGFVSNIDALIKKYTATSSGADASQLIEQVNTDIGQLITDTKTLETTLKTNVQTITSQLNTVSSTLQGQLTTLKNGLNAITTVLDADADNLGSATDLFRQLVLGEQIANLSHDFSDKVHKLSLDDLPDTAVIDLNIAGPRNLGNNLVIKLGTGKAGETTKDQFNRQFALYFCSLYARTAVGFLFVNPTPIFQRSGQNALFRYAPSYSILLKGFWLSPEESRKNIKYHSFYDPGLGLNFSTLDFKGDGSMALGIGGVFSIFNDFVQLGYGVNTFDGRGYAFFGFKLPVGSFSVH
jgi:hypothetical protein